MIEKQFFKYAAEFTAGGRIGVFCEPVVPFNTGGKGAAGDVGGADIDFPASAGETEYIAFGVKGAVRIIVEAQIQVLCNFTFEQIKGRRLGNAEVASTPDSIRNDTIISMEDARRIESASALTRCSFRLSSPVKALQPAAFSI